MKIIKISAENIDFPELFLRQTPNGHGIWGDCKFLFNQPVERCDWWVVCHGSGLKEVDSTICDPNHIVYISMEPTESIGNIKNAFLEQFSHLVLCDRGISHDNIIYANGLTWWVGMSMRQQLGVHRFSSKCALNYDILKAMPWPKKRDRISVVVSRKNSLDGHKRRLNFLAKIMELPVGRYVDIFGAGFNPIPDKWDAIEPYKYHLVFENDMRPDYWSEKLGDAFLGFAYPIYFGCPNISDFFPASSLLTMNIDDVEGAAIKLTELVEADIYQNHIEAIKIARDRVLDEYNIFQLIANICESPAGVCDNVTLKPNSFFSDSRLKGMLRQIISRRGALLSTCTNVKNGMKSALAAVRR